MSPALQAAGNFNLGDVVNIGAAGVFDFLGVAGEATLVVGVYPHKRV